MKIILKLTSIILIPFLVGINLPEKESSNKKNYHTAEILNPDHLDGPFTGGFGEQSCHSCHFDYDLNDHRGSLTVEGISGSYQTGNEYKISVILESEHLEIGGFQMTSRFEDGSQAGRFDWNDNRLTFTPGIGDEIQYLQHSQDGTNPTNERTVKWTFRWIAPDVNHEPVIFNIAANAGNNDDSAFGDWIYVKELISKPR